MPLPFREQTMDSASIVANSPSPKHRRPDLTSAQRNSDGGKVAQADAQAAENPGRQVEQRKMPTRTAVVSLGVTMQAK